MPYRGLVFLLVILSISACVSQVKVKKSQKIIALTYMRLGIGYINQGALQRGYARLLLAEKLLPHNGNVQDALGYYHEVVGESALAKRHYLLGIRDARNKGNALNNYGTYLCRLGDYVHAERIFSQAVIIQHYLYKGSAYENAGICALLMKNKVLAVKEFSHALHYDPRLGSALWELSRLYYQRHQFNLAKKTIRQFIQYHGNSAKALGLKNRLKFRV